MTCWWDSLLFLHFGKSAADPDGERRERRAETGQARGRAGVRALPGDTQDSLGTMALLSGVLEEPPASACPLLLTEHPQQTRRR